MNDFLVALGLFLAIEGILYAAFPGFVRQALEMLDMLPEQQLRLAGLLFAAIGVTIVWLVRS